MSENPGDPAVRHAVVLIDELRKQVDEVDATLLHALAQRMALVKQIGRHKKAASIAAVQMDRWRKLIEQRTQMGRNLKLSEGFIVSLFELIHRESVDVQNDLINDVAHAASERVAVP